jgi:hypothetical protein
MSALIKRQRRKCKHLFKQAVHLHVAVPQWYMLINNIQRMSCFLNSFGPLALGKHLNLEALLE